MPREIDEKLVLQALKGIRKPDKVDWTAWEDLEVVAQKLGPNQRQLDKAVREVLKEALEELKDEDQQQFLLLSRRFWIGETVTKEAERLDRSKTVVQDRQRTAIARLTQLILLLDEQAKTGQTISLWNRIRVAALVAAALVAFDLGVDALGIRGSWLKSVLFFQGQMPPSQSLIMVEGDLQISPRDPVVGEPVTVTFRARNGSGEIATSSAHQSWGREGMMYASAVGAGKTMTLYALRTFFFFQGKNIYTKTQGHSNVLAIFSQSL